MQRNSVSASFGTIPRVCEWTFSQYQMNIQVMHLEEIQPPNWPLLRHKHTLSYSTSPLFANTHMTSITCLWNRYDNPGSSTCLSNRCSTQICVHRSPIKNQDALLLQGHASRDTGMEEAHTAAPWDSGMLCWDAQLSSWGQVPNTNLCWPVPDPDVPVKIVRHTHGKAGVDIHVGLTSQQFLRVSSWPALWQSCWADSIVEQKQCYSAKEFTGHEQLQHASVVFIKVLLGFWLQLLFAYEEHVTNWGVCNYLEWLLGYRLA